VAKVCTACSNFFSYKPKNLYWAPKKYHLYFKKAFVLQKKHLYCKKSICTAKIAICTFYHTLGILLSFWHTFKYFCILSQLLAHCADLSKSEGQLCCCHETGLNPVLFFHDLASKLKYLHPLKHLGSRSQYYNNNVIV